MSQIEDFLSDKPSSQPKSGGDIDSFLSDAPKSYGLKDFGGDLSSVVTKGVMAVPQALVGLADIATNGQAGKALEDAGVRFNEANQIADSWKSDSLKAQQKEFQDAQGIGGKAVAALSNPGLVASTVAESIPSMLLGGAVAKGAGLAIPALAGRAGLAAAGEGAVMAGSQAESIRQQTTDGLLTPAQSALAAGTGVAGGLIGAAGARAAKALGIGDVDTMIANGAAQGVRDGVGLASRVGRGALSEGVLEELPQSLSETAFENVALDKPVTEGMDEAAVLGTLSGGLMGGVAGGLSRPAKPSQQMGIDPSAGPLSRAAATSVDSQPVPQLGFSPLAGTPIIYPDGSVALNSEQEFQKRTGAGQGMDLSKIAQPSQPLAAEKKPTPVAPSSESIPLEQRSLDELRQAFRSAQDPAIRKTLAAEIRKRREAMPDPLAPVQPQQEIALEPQASQAVQSQPQEAQAEPTEPVALGQPLTDAGTNLLGRGADPLQSIIQGQADARRAADVLRGTTGASTVTRGDITPPSVESPVADVRSGGRNDDAGTAQPDANGDAGSGVGSAAKGSAALRPDNWRGNAIKAGKVARSLGLDPKGKRLKEIVAEIDAVDAGSNVQNTPSSTAGTETKASPVEARAPEGGNAAADTGVPAAPGAGDVQADGVKEAWGLTREQYFNDPARVRREAVGPAAVGWKASYEYTNPSGSGPFKGSTVLKVKPNAGDTINAPFGRARVTAVSAVKGASIDNAELLDIGKAHHRRVVADAIASGKPVPDDVLAEYPDLSKNPRELNTSAEPVQKTSKNEQVAQADGVKPDENDDGIKVKEGKGLIKGKYLVDVDGDGAPGGPWDTPEQARLAGEEWKKKTIQNAKDTKQERDRWNAIAESFKSGKEVTTAQIESLGLKAGTSDVRWFFPIAARLFDITSRDIRPLVKGLIRDSFTDMGAKREFVPTRKALEAVAADVVAGEKKAESAIKPSEMYRRLQQLSARANRKPYTPLTEEEFKAVVDAGLATGKKWATGKLNTEGYGRLAQLEADETKSSNARADAEDLIAEGLPFKASAVDQYGLSVPDGYVRQGEMFAKAAPAAQAEKPAEQVNPEPSKAVQPKAEKPAEDDAFMGVGEKSLTADKDALELAKQRVAGGEEAEEVRKSTGWYQGKDGKWRYEIDDSGAKLKPSLFGSLSSTGGWPAFRARSVSYRQEGDGTYTLQIVPEDAKKTEDIATINGVQPQDLGSFIPDRMVKFVERGSGVEDFVGDFQEAKMLRMPFDFGGFNALPLNEVLDHPELFKAYPGLRTVYVQVDTKRMGDGASIHERDMADGTTTTVIKLNKATARNPKRALSALLHEVQHGIQSIEDFASGGSIDVLAKNGFEDPFKAYNLLAGEVEARNTQARQKMTAEERRQTPPSATADVAEDDQIVIRNAGEKRMASKRQGTPVDRAIMDMAEEGREANEILSFIAKSSKSPYRRQLAQNLLATGANPAVSLGGEMGGGAGFRFLAKYSRKNHEVTLSEAAGDRAEQIFLHETVHAATLLALDKGGLIATQMRRLAASVYKDASPEMRKMYGLVLDKRTGEVNVGEFVAEAFTNPDFQKALKGMKADNGSLWDRLVNIVRRILGMEPRQQDALSKALELGAGVMRENIPLRAARSFRAEDGPAYAGSMNGMPDNQAPGPQGDAQQGATQGNAFTKAAEQILQAMRMDSESDTYADYGLRVIPGDFTGDIATGDNLPPSNRWDDGDDTGETLAGTSVIAIKQPTVAAIQNAIRLIGADGGTRGPNGYYWGDRVVLVKGERKGSGEDVGEILLKDATVVGVWKKPSKGASTIKPNDQSAPDTDGAYFGIADAVEQIKAFDVKEAPKSTWAHYRGMALQALGRRQLVDLYGDEFGTHLHEYDTLVQQMDAEKNETGAEADDIAQRWGKLKDEKALAELMHDATLAKMDPDKPMPAGYSKAEYDKLKTRFNTLSPEAKTLYREARDMYIAHYKAVQQAIKDRIERSEMSPSEKKRMMAQLDDKLFKELQGVYFPLARFGQYVIVVKDANGEVKNVTRAETVKEAEQARKELQKAFPAHMGNTVGKVLKQAEFNAGRDAVGKGFMADLMNALDEKGVDDELRDTVAQLYLSSLPDLSWAKHGIHRKGTPGFSQDARRAFAQNAFHGARYLAKLRYSDRLQDELTGMQDYVNAFEGVEEYDSIQGQQVVDEMVKRHEILMNPKSSPVSTALTSFGFLFHMGLSPASAMVNLTQTALVAFPQMGAKWGFAKAGSALTKASEEVVRAKNDLSKALKGDELAAFDRAVKDGTIDVTMAHDLAGIAQGEDQGVMWKVRPVMRWASFMFHHAEKFNRQATFLAAFRLSKESNPEKSLDWHYEEAKKATYDGHFDYSAANRARIMQGNWQRVILLFKQYSQSMIYTLARNAYQSVKAIDPKERTQARKTLGGILAAHAAAAGVLGLPIVGPLLTVASWIGGDDDEPWDAEVAMQNAMAEMIGPKAAEVLARGFSRLTPFDLSGRVALNKLILPDVQEGLEGKEWAESAMAAALGPVAGIGVNMARGAQKITEGDYLRGLEDMMPTALRGPLKALRYANEGAVDKTGVVITDEVSAAGVLGQASGFSPSQVRRDTERRSAIYAYDRALLERRSVLMRMMAEARIQGDTETQAEVQKDIQRFNEKNPTRRITPMNIAQSVRNRRKRIDEAEQGVYLPSKRRDALDAVSF